MYHGVGDLSQDIDITQLNKGRIHFSSSFIKKNNLKDGEKFILITRENDIILKKIKDEDLRGLIK